MSTQMTSRRVVRAVEPKSAARPAKKTFRLLLQGGGALGADEVGAIKYLYERGVECAIAVRAPRIELTHEFFLFRPDIE